MEQPSDDLESHVQIELEYCRELYLLAAKMVRGDVEPRTWRAFEATVVESRSVDEAALELGMPIGSIYAARSRIMRRLRAAVEKLEMSES
jgi:RNA polymerase sigma-70 factor (ECF subfamily)